MFKMKNISPLRFFILGNSGSGKSWLSRQLALTFGLDQFALDELVWEKGGFYQRREESAIKEDLLSISQNDKFVMEGVYGDWAYFLSDKISHLIWLDLDSEACVQSVVSRGFDHIPSLNNDNKIQAYLDHIRSYGEGTGSMSRSCHEEVFRSFSGIKKKMGTRADVNAFVAEI